MVTASVFSVKPGGKITQLEEMICWDAELMCMLSGDEELQAEDMFCIIYYSCTVCLALI